MISRDQLGQMTCSDPECKEEEDSHILYIHSACHPTAALEAAFSKKDGTMRFTCDVCGSHILTVQVA